MRSLIASTLAQDLHSFLAQQGQCRVQVHSLFAHACNLQLRDGHLVSGSSKPGYIAPMGFSVQNLGVWPFRLGEQLILGLSGLSALDGRRRVSFDRAALWDPHTSFSPARMNPRAAAMLAQELSSGNQGIFTPLLPALFGQEIPPDLPVYAKFIDARVFELLDALTRQDWAAAADRAEHLVGFGPGLTPSADDFLAAILAAIANRETQGQEGPASFSQAVVGLASRRSSLVSAEMLRHAAQGKLPGPHQALIHALQADDLESTKTASQALLAVGANSGADFIFGLLAVHVAFPLYPGRTLAPVTLKTMEVNQ